MYHTNTNIKKAGVIISILGKDDIRTVCCQDKGLLIMIKGSIHKDDITIVMCMHLS